MTDDIVARLRGPYEWLTCRQFQHSDMATGDDAPFEAADEIERLRAALREAREDILLRHNARGSEFEGTDEEAVSFIDVALAGGEGQ